MVVFVLFLNWRFTKLAIVKTVHSTYFSLSYDDYIVTLHIKDGAAFDATESRQMFQAAANIANHQPYLLLTDARVYFSITSEGRKISAYINETHLLKANAVLINNLPARLIANFFGNFNKPHYKFKVFTSEEKAREWLLNSEKKGKADKITSKHLSTKF